MNRITAAAAAFAGIIAPACSPAPAHRGRAPLAPVAPLAGTAGDAGPGADEQVNSSPGPAPTTTEAPATTVTTVTITAPPAAPATTRRATTTTVYVEPFVLPEAETEETDEEWWANQRGPTPPEYIKQCESGGNYRAVNPNGHYGAWQFSIPTWRSVGGTGRPDQASPAEQDYRAALLWDHGRGAGHWECA